jgi:hypothetical protein
MAKQRTSTRTNRRQFTKGKVGQKAAVTAYYSRFRGGKNRAAQQQQTR